MTHDDRAVTLLRQELTTATAGLVPRPDVAARAAAGGRRRLRRRRITEAALTAGAALAVTVAVIAPLSLNAAPSQPAKRPDPAPSLRSASPPPGDPMLWLYHRPPQGDLADESTYVQSVIGAWNRSHATSRNAKAGIFDNLRGEPRVVWAGETPGGPAALVVQPAAFPDRATVIGVGPGDGTVVGFVGVDEERRPRVVDDSFSYDGVSPAMQPLTAWFVDPAATSSPRWSSAGRWPGRRAGATTTTGRATASGRTHDVPRRRLHGTCRRQPPLGRGGGPDAVRPRGGQRRDHRWRGDAAGGPEPALGSGPADR